jgi:hypothetical protein
MILRGPLTRAPQDEGNLEHVAQKWEPVLDNNMRKNKDLERSSDSIRTQSALDMDHTNTN